MFANDITYNAVLNACASVGQLDMALKLLEVMEEGPRELMKLGAPSSWDGFLEETITGNESTP